MRYFAAPGPEDAVPVDIEQLGREASYRLTLARRDARGGRARAGARRGVAPRGRRSYAVEFDERATRCRCSCADQVTGVDVADERRAAPARGAGGVQRRAGRSSTRPMPGKVVRVLVKVGDEVQRGSGPGRGRSDEDGERAEEPQGRQGGRVARPRRAARSRTTPSWWSWSSAWGTEARTSGRAGRSRSRRRRRRSRPSGRSVRDLEWHRAGAGVRSGRRPTAG